MTKQIVLLTLFLSIFQLNAQEKSETFYILPDQQIINKDNLDLIETDVDQKGGVIRFLDTIQKDGNNFVNVTFNLKDTSKSPYHKFYQMIGEKFPLKSFGIETNGKPMLLNFWFTSCRPCIMEIPDLNELKETYEDSVNFYAITFNSQEQVDKFEEKRPINFTHLTNQKAAIGKFGVRSYPTNLILDKDGIITFVSGAVGYSLNEFKYELNQLLTDQ